MGRNESKKRSFTLFLISLSLHLFVFAVSSHQSVWRKPDRTLRPLKFRVVSVEKPEKKLPPDPRSRFLSNANREESDAGTPSKSPRMRREGKDRVPSRRSGLGVSVPSLAPVPESNAPTPAVSPVGPPPPAPVTRKPRLKKVEKSEEGKPPDALESKETHQPIGTTSLVPAPTPKVPASVSREPKEISKAPLRPRRSAPQPHHPKDPLALFRVKPQPTGKPALPAFDLSDEEADKIAKRSLRNRNLEKEKGETISLDTRDFRYASYFAHIKRRIQNAWIWPEETRKYEGELLLRFRLRKNGTLEEVRLIKSAGVRILDDLAMAAVTKAAPFDPFPEGLERKTITATFVYE